MTGLGLSSGFVAGGSSGGSASLVASGGVFVAWVQTRAITTFVIYNLTVDWDNHNPQ